MTHTPRSFSASSVRARFVTATSGIDSAAPAATLVTVGERPALRSFGTITAWAPAASATRRHAPRLCGSVTPSSTRSSGGSCSPSRNGSRAARPAPGGARGGGGGGGGGGVGGRGGGGGGPGGTPPLPPPPPEEPGGRAGRHPDHPDA